jgi:hypothetical protein
MHKPTSTTCTSSRTTTRPFRPKDGLVNDASRRRSSAPPHRRMVQDTANDGFQEEGPSSRIPRRAPRLSSCATSVLLLCLSSLVISVESQGKEHSLSRRSEISTSFFRLWPWRLTPCSRRSVLFSLLLSLEWLPLSWSLSPRSLGVTLLDGL